MDLTEARQVLLDAIATNNDAAARLRTSHQATADTKSAWDRAVSDEEVTQDAYNRAQTAVKDAQANLVNVATSGLVIETV